MYNRVHLLGFYGWTNRRKWVANWFLLCMEPTSVKWKKVAWEGESDNEGVPPIQDKWKCLPPCRLQSFQRVNILIKLFYPNTSCSIQTQCKWIMLMKEARCSPIRVLNFQDVVEELVYSLQTMLTEQSKKSLVFKGSRSQVSSWCHCEVFLHGLVEERHCLVVYSVQWSLSYIHLILPHSHRELAHHLLEHDCWRACSCRKMGGLASSVGGPYRCASFKGAQAIHSAGKPIVGRSFQDARSHIVWAFDWKAWPERLQLHVDWRIVTFQCGWSRFLGSGMSPTDMGGSRPGILNIYAPTDLKQEPRFGVRLLTPAYKCILESLLDTSTALVSGFERNIGF